MKYISIGPTCYTAFMLKKHGLRDHSYPFDWLFSSLDVVEDCICDRFASFLDVGQLYDITSDGSKHLRYNPMLGTDILRAHYEEHEGKPAPAEVAWRFFNHHCLTDPETHAAFKRRAARFLECIRGGATEEVTLVYLNRHTDDSADVAAFVDRMNFPPNVRVLAFMENKAYTGDQMRVVRPRANLTVVYTHSPDAFITGMLRG